MNTKNLISPIKHINRFIIEDLSAELVELSEEDLQQISGGFDCDCGCGCKKDKDIVVITYPGGPKIEIPVPPQAPQKQNNSLSSW
jgi:bacteriocin-like protein